MIKTMVKIDDFVRTLLNGKMSKETYGEFTKFFNDQFEVLVFDNKVLVKDKRNVRRTIIYNSINIARAHLEGIST
jgi:hypothetical protein